MDLYYVPASAPCRSVLMVAAALKLKLNLKQLDLMNKEHLTPEFLKINPQHMVPTLVDNDFTLWESRAILIYLVEKYARKDELYPKNPKERAIINQRLYFDIDTLFKAITETYYPMFMGQEVDPENVKKLEEKVQLLETIMGENDFIAGSHLTIADFAIVTSMSTAEMFGFDLSPFPKIAKWYEVMKEGPGWEQNQIGLEVLQGLMKQN